MKGKQAGYRNSAVILQKQSPISQLLSCTSSYGSIKVYMGIFLGLVEWFVLLRTFFLPTLLLIMHMRPHLLTRVSTIGYDTSLVLFIKEN